MLDRVSINERTATAQGHVELRLEELVKRDRGGQGNDAQMGCGRANGEVKM